MARSAIVALVVAALAAGCGGSGVDWTGVRAGPTPTPSGTGTPGPVGSPTPLPSQAEECAGPMVAGVDVSDSQGTIDWTAARGAGIRFAWIKATQGDSYVASTFADDWAGAKSAGVRRGAYHFFDPTVDGTAQANQFLSVVGTLAPGDLPPAIDIECPDGDSACLGYAGGTGDAPASAIAQRIGDFIARVVTVTGRIPVVYTFPYYFSDVNIDASGLEADGLWIANYQTDCPLVPAPWSAARFWQSSDTANVAGIGSVDYDVYFGTEDELAQWVASP